MRHRRTSKERSPAHAGASIIERLEPRQFLDATGALAGDAGSVDGTWNGTKGITSSAAAAAAANAGLEEKSLGYMLVGDYLSGSPGSFDGVPVTSTDLLVKYTVNGDADLSGKVEDNDVTTVGTFYSDGSTTHHWYDGDFDSNGTVGSDGGTSHHWYDGDFDSNGDANGNTSSAANDDGNTASTAGTFHLAGSTGGQWQASDANSIAVLTPTITKAKLPSTVVSGGKVKGSATVRITNNGDAAPAGASTVELLAYSGASGVTVLASKPLKTLKAGKAANVSFSLKAIPALNDGTYALYARTVDPAQRATVSAAFATAVHVAAPVVSLTATAAAITPGTFGPRAVKYGSAITLLNSGTADATGTLRITADFFNGQHPAGTFSPVVYTFKAKIKAGQSRTFKLKGAYTPGSLPAGTYNVSYAIELNGVRTHVDSPTQVVVE